MRRAVALVGAGALCLGAFSLGLGLAERGSEGKRDVSTASVVDEVRAELASRYYRPVPREILRLPTVESMLAALKDPYTQYLDPAAYQLLRQATDRDYAGVGLSVLPARDGLLVTAAAKGPARRAGVRPGATIVAVDGRPLRGVAFSRALERIVGPVGTPVRLRVRDADGVRELRLVRQRVAAPVLGSRVLSMGTKRVGYMRLAGFRVGSAEVLRRRVRALEARGVSALVLDLRANPGGLLDQAVSVVSLFVDRGVVVSVESAHHREVLAARDDAISKLPLVVLVDRNSASAAEVVAAALHDHRRAVLVGEATFGKALVQTVTPLENGAALQFTTARYRTPAGHDLSDRGIRPDVVAVDDPATRDDEALTAALAAVPS